jgi:histidine triad (HIT) family protein
MSADPNCIFLQDRRRRDSLLQAAGRHRHACFHGLNPVNDGHALIIPKAHYPTVFDIAPKAIAAAARTTRRIAQAVNAALQPDGINLMQANGPGAGQSVEHFHFHVLPRRLGDGLVVNWTPKPGDHAHIAEIAERIRQHL